MEGGPRKGSAKWWFYYCFLCCASLDVYDGPIIFNGRLRSDDEKPEFIEDLDNIADKRDTETDGHSRSDTRGSTTEVVDQEITANSDRTGSISVQSWNMEQTILSSDKEEPDTDQEEKERDSSPCLIVPPTSPLGITYIPVMLYDLEQEQQEQGEQEEEEEEEEEESQGEREQLEESDEETSFPAAGQE
ncbi:hypothetical protein J4Q44_G00027120 [Coregonus suidteri]|uniref:Uncharacterized protein n=1 Tax=Coregonus suidteri TaxID=861788 RepID=A0AAN8RGQ8_9TELE